MSSGTEEGEWTLSELLKNYSVDFFKIGEWVIENQIDMVGLQVPEGFLRFIPAMVEHIEGICPAIVITSLNPCYGACDLADERLINLGAKGLVHLGHTAIAGVKRTNLPVLYLEVHARVDEDDLKRVVDDVVDLLSSDQKRMGIISTVQYLHLIPKVKELLTQRDLKVIIGDEKRGQVSYAGQVLGCDFTQVSMIEKEVDCYLYLGSGMFHPTGAVMVTDKPLICADLEQRRVVPFEEVKEKRELLIRQRGAAIARAEDAKTFGIVVGTKSGQSRGALARRLLDLLRDNGKRGYLLAVDEVSPERLEYLGMDAFVSTACPRIALDDIEMFKQPLITPIELEILLGVRDWDDYIIDLSNGL